MENILQMIPKHLAFSDCKLLFRWISLYFSSKLFDDVRYFEREERKHWTCIVVCSCQSCSNSPIMITYINVGKGS